MSAYVISVVGNLKNGLFYDHLVVPEFLDVSAYVIRWLEISIMGFLCHCGDIFNSSNGF